MSRCGECKLGCNKEGALYCEENLGYEQCIDRLQDALYAVDRPQVNPDLVKDFLKRQYEAILEENKKLVVGKWQAEQVLQTIIQQLEYVLEHGAVDEDGTHPITVENVLTCIRVWMKGADDER